jgi:nucleoside-diphosphate-sugar epimerase
VKVLVTGASGMLGRATATALAAAGHEVTVMQRGSSGLAGVSGITEVRADLTDRARGRWACTGQDAVVHLAAKVQLHGPWEEFERVNVQGTRDLLESAQEAGAQRFVYVSSPSAAHAGEPLVGVDAEPADPEAARGHYARSKAMAEQLALSADRRGFSVVAVRPHLVWGPGDTQLVGRVVERAHAGRLVLVGGGSALVDSTYVDNAADALVAALDRAPDVHGEAFVVSNGEPRPIGELLARMCRAAGAPEPTRSVPTPVATTGGAVVEQAWQRLGRDDEPPMTRFLAEQLATAHWFDQRRTQTALRWRPRVSLDEGFERLAASFQRDD